MAISPIVGTLLAAAGGGLIKLLFTHLSNKLDKKKWQKAYEQAEIIKDSPPPQVFAPMAAQPPQQPPAPPPPPANAYDARRQMVQDMLLDAELSEAQFAMRKLRRSLDEMTHELAERKAELVIARSMYDEQREDNIKLINDNEKLKAENARLKKELEKYESRDRPTAAARDEHRVVRPLAGGRVLPPPGVQGRNKDR
jgi:cell division protein FtsB